VGGGGFKTQNYSVATKSFIVCLIKDQQTLLSFLLLRLLQGEKQNKKQNKTKKTTQLVDGLQSDRRELFAVGQQHILERRRGG
jgi:hypothetical protein